MQTTALKNAIKAVLPVPLKRKIQRMITSRQYGNSTPYYNSADFPFAAILEAGWRAIRKEVEALEEQQLLLDWPGRSPSEGRWYGFGLIAAGVQNEENCRHCPETIKLLNQVPGLRNAGFLALAPGAKVLSHVDSSKTLMRCSLTLMSPKECEIRVADEVRGWEEGKCMMFDPVFNHEVWNDGTSPRMILQLGIVKPGVTHDDGDEENLNRTSGRTPRSATGTGTDDQPASG